MSSLDPAPALALLHHYRATTDVFRQFTPPPFGQFGDGDGEIVAEVAALLRSIDTAGNRYRIVSLGAAPGEWPLWAERAYRARHPQGDFRSFSLEGDLDHHAMTERFIVENGGDPAVHDVRYKVIAEKDGWAYFPIINPDADWGAGVAAVADSVDALDDNMRITDMARQDRIASNHGKPLEFRTVEAVSLATLLAEAGPVDFLHSDIQGAEGEVFPPQMAALGEHVRICCIGTHSRAIENSLTAAFAQAGWIAECGHPCVTRNDGAIERTLGDGVLVWSNPRLT